MTKFRSSYLSSMSRLVPRVVRPIMRKQGFFDIDIVSDWAYIIGPEWSKMTLPQKLKFAPNTRANGVLHVRVAPGASVLLQHIEPEIIDRVNTYFGFQAVAKLKLIHGVIPQTEVFKPKPKVDAPMPTIEGIEDDGLTKALQEFGQALAAKTLSRDKKS